MKRKGLFVGVLVLGIVCFAAQSAMAQPHYLDGLWFKLKAAVKGYKVDKTTGDIVVHNFTVPLYMGFAWNETESRYDVRVYTQTEPGVWANTSSDYTSVPDFTQNFISDFGLDVYTSTTDYFESYHTPYIRYVLDDAGAVKKATYSGTGEVFDGSFDADASAYFGYFKISGTTVSTSKLPFTP